MRLYGDGSRIAETEGGEGFITVQIQRGVALKVKVSYGKYHREINIAENVDVMPIRFPEVKYVADDERTQRQTEAIAFYVGIVFSLLTVLLAIFFPNPTAFQFRNFTGFFSIGLGGVALRLSGMLSVRLTLGQRVLISATGALAVFVLAYFFVPAQ